MNKLLVLLILLVGCTTGSIRHDMDSVTIGTDGESKLDIDEKKSISYGPGEAIEGLEKKVKEPVISLLHHPTMYHSQAIISFLKSLEKENIKVSIISSYGFGSLIAGLYAKQRSTSYVEWKFFTLLKELKQKKMYGKEWTTHLNSFIDKEFGEKKANQLEVLLVIPTLESGELKLDFSSKVATLIKQSINIQESSNIIHNPESYAQTLKKQLSSDLNYELAFLPVAPVVSELEPFQYGVYTSYLGKILIDPEAYGIISTPQKMDIDQIGLTTELDDAYGKKIDHKTQSIVEQVKQWKKDHSPLNNQ